MPPMDEEQLERLTRRIAADSGGIPLLAVELLQAILGGLDLGATTPDWPKPFRTLEQTLPSDLPEAVVGAIRVRFRRLSPAAQQVIQVVAVLGDRISASVVGPAAGLDIDGTNAALDEVEWQRWVHADSRGYSFVARIVRDVILRDLVTQGQRERIQDTVGESSPE